MTKSPFAIRHSSFGNSLFPRLTSNRLGRIRQRGAEPPGALFPATPQGLPLACQPNAIARSVLVARAAGAVCLLPERLPDFFHRVRLVGRAGQSPETAAPGGVRARV